ncbi:MAG: 3-deoxy-D-manno-octulosonic acid transferase [Chthoniobacterales bacterium]|nr:3-deoxy-D-manno-octulosonic acid transferase [Chthoniobacterales bacterium]
MMFGIRWIYNLVFPIVLLVMLPGFLHRMLRRGKYRHKFWQRFGLYSPRVRKRLGNGRRIWIHAVSVGEILIAKKLIREMRRENPAASFVLSTTTSTGFKLAAREKSPWLEPIYNPLDFYFTARRAVRTIRPRMLILVEAEVWPNIVCEARAVGAGIALVNARLSPRSERRFRAARWITAPVFNQLDLLCLQEPEDIERWAGLGVERKRLIVTGSIKFDDSGKAGGIRRDFTPVLSALGVEPGAPVLLAGSTFEGEEILVAEVYRALRQEFPNLFLIIVPRHFERAPAVASQLEKSGFQVALRTRPPTSGKSDLLLVDTTGELRDWFACATVVFMGKSLCAKGGQNPAEPVAAGVPVVFGPYMQNFATLSRQFLRHGGAREVSDAQTLQEAVACLLADPLLRETMAANARGCLEVHQGATARTVAAIGKI